MGNLVVMCGMCGSGKTKFAKNYAVENNYLYLCPDDFYALLNGDECIHENKFEVWMALFRAIHTAEQSGKNVILDSNSPTLVDRVQLLDWFPHFEKYTLIFIDTPIEVCKENNRMRRRQIPDKEMDRLWSKFQRPSKEEDERWSEFLVYSWEKEK